MPPWSRQLQLFPTAFSAQWRLIWQCGAALSLPTRHYVLYCEFSLILLSFVWLKFHTATAHFPLMIPLAIILLARNHDYPQSTEHPQTICRFFFPFCLISFWLEMFRGTEKHLWHQRETICCVSRLLSEQGMVLAIQFTLHVTGNCQNPHEDTWDDLRVYADFTNRASQKSTISSGFGHAKTVEPQ